MSERINIGAIDGTRVFNHIDSDNSMVSDTNSFFIKISIKIITLKITINKLEYFFIFYYMI